ncbi:glycosyltransferase [Niveibacterium sp. SC-1]|uniref:glycosyltransferase n=1 Tax=Niveibacterium sp. SC-1 TaxID=3135646 RepID=UPI00311FC903
MFLTRKRTSLPAGKGAAQTALVQAGPNVQRSPWKGTGAAGDYYLKVDAARRFEGGVLLEGWLTSDLVLGLHGKDGKPLLCHIHRFDREDVAAHFNLSAGVPCGFLMVVDEDAIADAGGDLHLVVGYGTGAGVRAQLEFDTESVAALVAKPYFAEAVLGLLRRSNPFTPLWRGLVQLLPTSTEVCDAAKGVLEVAGSREHDSALLAVGWVVCDPASLVWLECDDGNFWPLDGSYRFFRSDVYGAVGARFAQQAAVAGFIAHREGPASKRTQLKLRTLDERGVHTLAMTQVQSIPGDTVAAANWLLSQWTSPEELHARIPLVDGPMIDRSLEDRKAGIASLPIKARSFGTAPSSPEVSIIVPLYGRSDFVEHQLIEFARDPWLLANAEIIYVVDDPALVTAFRREAEALFDLYRIPFSWVWGSINRGFSGANNLGATHARGHKLLFLNSDAFPREPGWLQRMVETLDARPDIGVLAPRLLFADGSVQHAGMEFRHRADLGIWINHHPHIGIDPALDPHPALTEMPAVTGACMLVRREDFDRVGGWDTGYLIGDFEDSDLCFKLREIGLIPAYMPEVELTHLERQSFKLLGSDDFRSRVVIFNAVRHQTRWGAQIAALARNHQENQA